jgi:hypothetical protein
MSSNPFIPSNAGSLLLGREYTPLPTMDCDAFSELCAIVSPHEARSRCRLILNFRKPGRRWWTVLPPSTWIVLAYSPLVGT